MTAKPDDVVLQVDVPPAVRDWIKLESVKRKTTMGEVVTEITSAAMSAVAIEAARRMGKEAKRAKPRE